MEGAMEDAMKVMEGIKMSGISEYVGTYIIYT